jgi:catechol 2,3-dioxygenase-like lactoylglutathione lyase family enzyme
MIRRLHHNAYRCRDSEETRRFYEDFLGLRLAGTLEKLARWTAARQRRPVNS